MIENSFSKYALMGTSLILPIVSKIKDCGAVGLNLLVL